LQVISLSDIFISPLEDMYGISSPHVVLVALTNDYCSYFVTELLGTDLHRLLTSRPLEKQFIQYFLYQILASLPKTFGASALTMFSVV
jgi:p38 MAP kinase